MQTVMGHARRENSAFGQRRAGDTARWRERVRCGRAVYPVEVDETTFQLMERFGRPELWPLQPLSATAEPCPGTRLHLWVAHVQCGTFAIRLITVFVCRSSARIVAGLRSQVM